MSASDIRWLANFSKRIGATPRGNLYAFGIRLTYGERCSFCDKAAIGGCIAHTGGTHEVRVCRQHYEAGRRNFLEIRGR